MKLRINSAISARHLFFKNQCLALFIHTYICYIFVEKKLIFGEKSQIFDI